MTYYFRVRAADAAGLIRLRNAPFGTAETSFRKRAGRLLIFCLPLLMVMHHLGPSELLVGVPHTQGHPVTALPEEVLSHMAVPGRMDAPGPTLGDMTIRVPAGGGAPDAGCPIGGPSCPFVHPSAPSVRPSGPLGPAPPPSELPVPQPPAPAPRPPAPAPPAGMKPSPEVGVEGGGQGRGKPGAPAGPLPGRQGGGVAPKAGPAAPAGPRGSPSSLGELQASCSIRDLVQPLLQSLEAHTSSLDSDLELHGRVRRAAQQAERDLRDQLEAARSQLAASDARRAAAVADGDYATAAAEQAAAARLAAAAGALEARLRAGQDAADELLRVESAARQKQAGQLLSLSQEMRRVAAAAAAAIQRLQTELSDLLARADVTKQARGNLGQALSQQAQATALRSELRGLAARAQQAQQQAAESVQAGRTANRAVLEDAAGLAGNRSRAEALSHAAEGELALLREQLELALQLQDYEHAGRLAGAVRQLEGAVAEGQDSSGSWERLADAHRAVAKQRLSEFRSHVSALDRAARLAQDVQDLRTMYDEALLEEGEVMSLATHLAVALEELAAAGAAAGAAAAAAIAA